MATIKKIKQTELREVNVREWTDEKAYVKNLNAIERLLVGDFFREYVNEELSERDRAISAAKAAITILVDKDGNPLFVPDDVTDLIEADYAPISRIFSLGLDPDLIDKSLKKK